MADNQQDSNIGEEDKWAFRSFTVFIFIVISNKIIMS